MLMQFFIYGFLVVIIAVLIFVLWMQCQQTSRYRGPLTDHFDGKKFFNPAPYRLHASTDILHWMFKRQKAKWPAKVSNTATPDLSPVPADNIKVTFVNHATVLVQTEHLNFLTDPIWSERTSPYSWIGPKRVRDPGIRFADLPKIDVVLISHNHYDHLDLATLKKLAQRFHPLILVPLGDKDLLTRHGIDNVMELDWWQSTSIKNHRITFLPTQHWSARGLNDKFNTLWGSYGIEIAKQKIYFAGDTGYSANFKLIQQRWGAPDLALLPIGSYLPAWFMGQNHMNPLQATMAHKDLGAKHSIAIHFRTFQLSDESIDQPVIDLQKAISAQQLAADAFVVLAEGESRLF